MLGVAVRRPLPASIAVTSIRNTIAFLIITHVTCKDLHCVSLFSKNYVVQISVVSPCAGIGGILSGTYIYSFDYVEVIATSITGNSRRSHSAEQPIYVSV